MQTVALLIPLHNSSKYIADLLRQAKIQTSPFDEIICYDDGSEDDCGRIAESMGAHLIGAVASRRQAHARNCLWKTSTSQFVHFHDHDDPLHPDFLKHMRPYLAERTVTICPFREIRGSEITLHRPTVQSASGNYGLVFEQFVHINSMIVDRNMLNTVGGFDEDMTLNEEKLFLLRLLDAGASLQVASQAEADWLLSPETSFMYHQGWLVSAEMFCRFVERSIPLVPDSCVDSFLRYVLYNAWLHCNQEPASDPIVDSVFALLKRRGWVPTEGLGRITAATIRLVGPSLALRLRRARSRLRRPAAHRSLAFG